MSACTTSGSGHLVPYIKLAAPRSTPHTLNTGLIKLTSKTNICCTGDKGVCKMWSGVSRGRTSSNTCFSEVTVSPIGVILIKCHIWIFFHIISFSVCGWNQSQLGLTNARTPSCSTHTHTHTPVESLCQSLWCDELKCHEPTSAPTA